ncbi:MAG: heme exporter protein CcmB [Actinomycetia bacterium]|nr:heme exporter protein CcmB [Actinomycetes bacterium]
MTTGFWHQVRAVIDRDLLRERRQGDMLWITIPFGAIALLLIPLAIGTDAVLLREIGPGMYWVIVMLFGVLVAVSRASRETLPQQDASALLGLDPAAGFVGRTASSAVFLLIFEVVVGVVAVGLYDISLIGIGWLVTTMLLVAIGLALLGTLTAAIVNSSTAGAALVPLLVAPLSVPLLLGATQTYDGLQGGYSILSWVLLMVAVVLVVSIIGVLTARPLQET